MAFGGRGYAGERGERFSGLQQASSNGHLFQIPGTGLDGSRQRLAGSVMENLEGAEKLGTAEKDTGTRGRHTTGLGDVIQGNGTGGTPIWVIEMGDDPPHGQIHGGFSSQSFQADYGETAEGTDNGSWEYPPV